MASAESIATPVEPGDATVSASLEIEYRIDC